MNDPFSTLAQARLLATGSPPSTEPPNLSPCCGSQAEFDALVMGYYAFFNDSLAQEVAFLDGLAPNPQVKALRQLIYNLRTSIAHGDNPKAEEAAARWRRQYQSPQDAADALAAELMQVLVILSGIAVAAARNPGHTARWQELLSVDVGTIFSAVAADLGLSFTEGNRMRMVRLVEGRLKNRQGRGDRRLLVADYCAQQITADRRPLPVPYDQILDALGLIGKAQASAAILVAHSVAEISPRLNGEAFVARVEEAWRALRAQ